MSDTKLTCVHLKSQFTPALKGMLSNRDASDFTDRRGKGGQRKGSEGACCSRSISDVTEHFKLKCKNVVFVFVK